MPVLLYFLLLCKSSKERCPRPLFGAKASAKVRTSTETAKHFRDIFSIFFPEKGGIYPLQPEKSTPHGKNSPPGLQNGPLAALAQWHTLKEITRNLSEIYGDFLARVHYLYNIYECCLVGHVGYICSERTRMQRTDIQRKTMIHIFGYATGGCCFCEGAQKRF